MIGKLQRVKLREVWKHEALDFTTWLEENIDVLNDALDLTLVNVEREQHAGSFSADLVAEDESGQSSDRGETLNQNLFLASARLAFLTAAAVANGEYQPEQRQSRQEAPG